MKNDLEIRPKSVFMLDEIILNKKCVFYVFVLLRDVFEE